MKATPPEQTVKLLLLFLLTSVAGGVGRYGGLVAGAAIAPGAGLFLQLLSGSVLLVGAVLLAERFGLIKPYQRRWTIAGGIIGVAMSTIVTLSTLSSPVAPYVIPGMIGMGASLASLIGKSAHERPDLT